MSTFHLFSFSYSVANNESNNTSEKDYPGV